MPDVIELKDEELVRVSGGKKREPEKKRKPEEKHTGSMIEICPQCGKEKLKHRVCPYCGYYSGKDLTEV